MKAKSHIAGWTAACMIMTALFGGAASADSVIVTTGRLNMRKDASADSKSVSVVEQDDALSFVSENGDWYQVRDDGTDGYVMKEYVRLDITQIEADVEENTELFDQEVTGKALARVNMRSLPLTESEIVKVVSKGGSADVLGVCGDWYLIRYGGKTGYIMGEYLAVGELPSDETPEEEAVTVPENPSDEESAAVSYTVDRPGMTNTRVNMRKSATTDSSIVKVLSKNASVTVTGEENGWYAVTGGGKSGYILKAYVTLSEGAGESDEEVEYAAPTGGKANTRVNMRKSATTDASVLKVIPKNATVSVTGEENGWYAVTYSGKSGYVLKEYIDLSQAGTESDEEIEYASPENGTTTTRVNLRKSASTSSTVVNVLSGKMTVSILGESGDWYRVSAGGKTGYVLKEYISAGEEIYTYDVTGRTVTDVNLREEASTSCKAICVLDKGTEVKVIGKVSSWFCVTVDGKKGYVSSEYITLVTDSPLPDVEPEAGDDVVEEGLTTYPAARTGATNERVNLRGAASTSAEVIKILNKNTAVTVLGELSSFYQVKYGGTIGYIVKDYVTLGATGSTEDSSDTTDKTDDTTDTLYPATIAASTTVNVNMRREPEGDVLHTLSAGTQVTLIGERGVWYKVIYGNSTGYIAMQYVTENVVVPEQPEDDDATGEVTGSGTKGYITAASVNMRRGAGTGYGVIKVLTMGEEITCYTLTDGWYMVKSGDDTGYVSAKYVSETAPDAAPSNPGSNASSGKVQQADWWTSDIQKVFKVGTIATVTDVDTGLSWQVKRSGGSNHADVQPLTAEDTAKMKQAYNGVWSWDRHAIWVTVNGVRYAASMNGMPHGSGSITTNNFDGHHCIHFLNSRTHTGNRWDTAHQSMVQKAYKAGQ